MSLMETHSGQQVWVSPMVDVLVVMVVALSSPSWTNESAAPPGLISGE
jgi:hypothetical protein